MKAPPRIAAVGLEHDEIYRVLDRLRHHEAAALVAIAERSGRLRMAAAGRYRVPVFPRLAPLLDKTDVDAVLVATANGDKAAAIQEALHAGKHVIAHAPLAITLEQLTAVEAAQGTTGAALVLLLPLRFTPAYVRLRDAAAQGVLGAICQVVIINSQKVAATPRTQAFYATKTHGGVLTSLAVHDIDVLRWLGGEVTVAYAATQRHGLTEHPDFEDAGLVRCALTGGGEGIIACNWLAPDGGAPFHEVTLIGTEGTAWLHGGKMHALSRDSRGLAPESIGYEGYMTTHSEAGHAFPLTTGQTDHDIDAAMLNAALTSLGDEDKRAAATTAALRTTRAAVQAQHIAWQDGA